jgi:DNA-binding NarL/FixJ family response regulator
MHRKAKKKTTPEGGAIPPAPEPGGAETHTPAAAPPPPSKLRVLVVDDHPVVRRGLIQTLTEAFPGAQLGEAANAQEAIDQIWNREWDVVVLDVSMPGRSGLDVLKEVRQERQKLPVLVLSMYPEDEFALRVLQNGAAGYLTKQTAPAELVAAVRKVLSGGRYISVSVAEKLAEHLDRDIEKAPHHLLSDREYQVMCMLASGKTVKEIGAELSLSIKTISTYRSRILEKMLIKNNAELMRYAVEHELVDYRKAR